MRKIIKLKENQLKTYLKRKRAKNIYNEILTKIDENSEFLNPKLPIDKINKEVIEDYDRLGLINEEVKKLLLENKKTNKLINL